MHGFTTDFQIIPADAVLTMPGKIVQPTAPTPILSFVPGSFEISADTAKLIARSTRPQIPMAA